MGIMQSTGRLLRGVIAGVGIIAGGLLAAAPAWSAAASDNASCLSCHDGKDHKIEVQGANGKPRTLNAFAADKLAAGVHGKMQCVACHTGITEVPAAGKGHAGVAGQSAASASCADCHTKLWDQARKDNTAAAKPRLGVVVDNIQAYGKSFHARPGKADKSKPLASCDGCHDTHTFNVPPKGSPAFAQWKVQSVDSCASKCHSEAQEEYAASVHGKEVLEKANAKAAVCADCHTAHAVGNTSAEPIKLAITANCGSCHKENYNSYKATYHGQVTTLGYAYTAKCYDCHGAHGILKVNNPESKVHPNNRMDTCKTCHNGKKGIAEAPAGFASFQPHGTTDNFQRYPQMWIGYQIMVQLLLGTFGFFWLHTLLWFYREYKERKAGASVTMVNISALPPGTEGKAIERFSRTWRIAHITFALSLMILTVTGMPLFYPDAAWAPLVMKALGGPQVAGLIHRINAVVFAGVFFWHLLYMGWGLWKNRKTFRWFGPDSLIPNLQDLWDIIAMFKWFLGKGPRPIFDRWAYWEKFDYWAPFWGVTIIGVSGLMMWLPHVFGAFLPGWVFNVAAIFHGEEAFLAVVFLFTVHFFNNHFRPDKFPVEVVMFTGRMSLAHFRKEHALQYQRLVDSGELEKYLVDAPSAPMTFWSKALGFTLIAIGLTLLAGVAIGFFGGA